MIVLAVIGRVCFVGGRWQLCSRDGRDVSASIGGCLCVKKLCSSCLNPFDSGLVVFVVFVGVSCPEGFCAV